VWLLQPIKPQTDGLNTLQLRDNTLKDIIHALVKTHFVRKIAQQHSKEYDVVRGKGQEHFLLCADGGETDFLQGKDSSSSFMALLASGKHLRLVSGSKSTTSATMLTARRECRRGQWQAPFANHLR
jgi:hypothetical protein